MDRAQVADPAVRDERQGPLPLGMEAVHERLHHLQVRPRVRRRYQAAGVRDGEAQWLLDQHVLAGLEHRDRPGDVEVVRERYVDDVDVGVGEERLVAAVRRAVPRGTQRRTAASYDRRRRARAPVP